jgi:CO/xanthine dehydrogenase Mo-binding subunit
MPLAKRFHYNGPPTILDAPANVKFAALNIADPETPVGARGVGESPVGAGYAAILTALADALGDDVFRRTPVTPDLILASLELGHGSHDALTTNV